MTASSVPMPLDLTRLRQGFPGLSPEGGASLASAAAVCLEEQGHATGVVLDVRGDREASFVLSWPQSNDQLRREWSYPEEATEHGACGIAVLLIVDLAGYHIVRRSRKGTGFDYWLGLKDDPLFQNTARLEVSGIRRGRPHQIEARVRQKARQVRKPVLAKLPAFIVVVEFSSPQASLVVR